MFCAAFTLLEDEDFNIRNELMTFVNSLFDQEYPFSVCNIAAVKKLVTVGLKLFKVFIEVN